MRVEANADILDDYLTDPARVVGMCPLGNGLDDHQDHQHVDDFQ